MAERKAKISTILGLGFFFFILVLLIWGKIQIFLSPIPETGIDYAQYPWYLVPVIYIYNYFLNAGVSLAFAFLLAGIIQVFISQDIVIKYLGSGKKRNYLIAILIAPVFITCSCAVVPVYAGLLMAGAGIGVAMTFLLMAPAANFLTLWVTGDYIGWDLVFLRFIFSAIAAIICGLIFAKTKTARDLEKKYENTRIGKVQKLIEERDIHEKVFLWYQYSWQMVKVILPYLLIGLTVVSFLAAYLPEEIISIFLTGYVGIILGAAVGGPLYTPTLVEVVLTKELLINGMSRSAALSFMMGQPYDVVSMFPNSKFFKWKGVALYTLIFFMFSVFSGLLYGLFLGEL